jgi:hypothetical protein
MTLLFGAAILSACNALTDTDDLEFVLGPEGKICSNVATDCPVPPNACQVAKCEARRCLVENRPAGPLEEQTAGDCSVAVCDGDGGLQSMPDDADFVDDGKECSTDACEAGVPVHTLKEPKTSCSEGGGSMCDEAGVCVGCVDDTDCQKPSTCSAKKACLCSPPCPGWSEDFKVGEGRSIAIDGGGGVLVTGWFSGTSNFGGGPFTSSGEQDIFVAKFNASGGPVWSQRFGDAMSQSGNAVASDSAGNVILAGNFAGTVTFAPPPLVSAGGSDVFLAKFDVAGNEEWNKSFGGSLDDEVTGMAVDGAGYILLTGRFKGTIDFGGGPLVEVCAGLGDLFIAKFDPQGTHQWSKSYCLSGDARAAAIATDFKSNLMLTGYFDGSISFGLAGDTLISDGRDAFAVKLMPNGDHAWSRSFGGPGAQEGTGVAADNKDHLIVTGEFEGSTDFGGGALTSAGKLDAFVVKLSALDGSTTWSKRFGDDQDQRPTSIGVTDAGNPIVTGVLNGSIDFGGGALPASASPQIFLAKLTSENGDHLFSRAFGGVGPAYSSEIAVNPAGDLGLTGYYTGGIDFGLGELPYSEMDMTTPHIFLFLAPFVP